MDLPLPLLKMWNSSLSPISRRLLAYIHSNCYLSIMSMNVHIEYVWMDRATYLRLGSEGMPLDKGRGDGGGGGGGEVLCGS